LSDFEIEYGYLLSHGLLSFLKTKDEQDESH
jgi:hypothetical protein